MKHGDREKGKTAKAASQASGKSGKTVTVLKGGKAGEGREAAGDNGKSAGSKKAGAAGGGKSAGEKSGSRVALQKEQQPRPVEKSDGGAKAARRASGGEPGTFNNPVVASAFKRAVAKYPNAFRKLTD